MQVSKGKGWKEREGGGGGGGGGEGGEGQGEAERDKGRGRGTKGDSIILGVVCVQWYTSLYFVYAVWSVAVGPSCKQNSCFEAYLKKVPFYSRSMVAFLRRQEHQNCRSGNIS